MSNIYLRSDGDDRNDGLSEDRPIKTFKRAYEIFEDMAKSLNEDVELVRKDEISVSLEDELNDKRDIVSIDIYDQFIGIITEG